MKLSICVPHYNEPYEVCKYLFDTIATQSGIDKNEVEILIGNDGSDNPLKASDFEGYPYKVRIVDLPHRGVSATRNSLIDSAEGEYLMLCDCDDGFCQNYGFYLIFGRLANKPDCIINAFVEESMLDGEFRLIRHDRDMNFVHGKVYRREFLNEKEIRFKEDLTVHEDGYFNTIVAIEGGEHGELIDNPYYVWRWNPDSTVRKEGGETFLIKTYGNLLDARTAVCEDLYERGFISEYFDAVAKTLIDAYYDFQKPDYLDPKNERIVKRAERKVKKFYDKFKDSYNECNINRIAEIMQISRTNAFAKGMRVEQSALKDWIKHIAEVE